MKLSDLLARAGVEAIVRGDADVSAITIDSRRVSPGALFVCMPGMTRDSQSFLPNAAAQGASAAMVYDHAGLESALSLGLAAFWSLDYDNAVGRICDTFFEHPTRRMKVVGITGTNGKTTTAWLLRDILENLGLRSAYLGTLGYKMPGEHRELANTTPFAVELYNLLAEARDKGVEALAMEVSSHALAQKRVDGVEFDVAVFTNLTQDHLDFHHTMEEYEAAKWRLFGELARQTAKPCRTAINVGDPVGRRWAEKLGKGEQTLPAWSKELDYSWCGRDRIAFPDSPYRFAQGPRLGALGEVPRDVDLVGCPEDVALDRIHLVLEDARCGDHGFVCNLGGSYNVENLISAVAGGRCLGYTLEEVTQAANGLKAVPGRFEPVPNGAGISILVDYAHTPDAVEKLLDAVRSLTSGRVITVFGCGGDRDKAKRPLMARSASDRSDLTVVTSDNPRTEDPAAIVRDVEAGIVPGRQSQTILDRREAIAYAVRAANPGDVVVIAGKGHENYQIIGREKIHMDDRELAREALN